MVNILLGLLIFVASCLLIALVLVLREKKEGTKADPEKEEAAKEWRDQSKGYK